MNKFPATDVELAQFKVSDTSAVSVLILISVKDARLIKPMSILSSKLEDQSRDQHLFNANTLAR